MAKKFYAVKKGKVVGIFESWTECKDSIDGYGGAEFKGFMTREEAESYLDGTELSEKTSARDGAVVAYVDGSYKVDTKEFSYGAVIFVNGEQIEMSHAYDDPEYAQMRNVAGEIVGAGQVMRYCIKNGIEKLDLYHDYEGIAKWCTGEWKTTKSVTARYREFYDSIKDRLDVRFVKVKGHSGDKYNDRADELAKSALGIGEETV